MTKILNISTIDKNINVFIQEDNNIIDFIESNKTNSQAELLVYLVEELFKKNNLSYKDIDCFSVINGPGSFIGIKVAISFIKAIKSVYKNKKFIVNNAFDILSFDEQYDYILLKADLKNYYIKDRNNNIDIINSFENIENNSILLTNINDIDIKKNIVLKNKDISINSISKLNYFKYKNNLFNNNIEALYIREPQINIKKNE